MNSASEKICKWRQDSAETHIVSFSLMDTLKDIRNTTQIRQCHETTERCSCRNVKLAAGKQFVAGRVPVLHGKGLHFDSLFIGISVELGRLRKDLAQMPST